MPKTPKPDSPEKVEADIEHLLECYRLGEEIRDAMPKGPTYSQGIVNKVSKKRGISTDMVRKLRTLADPERGYTEPELEDLFRVCRSKGRGPSISIVFKFLSVAKDDGQRSRFQREAIEGRWRRTRVDQELRKQFGRRREGGRRRVVPDDPGNVLAQLEGMCFNWSRWCSQVADRNEELPAKVKSRLKAASKTLDLLRQCVDAELSSNEPRS